MFCIKFENKHGSKNVRKKQEHLFLTIWLCSWKTKYIANKGTNTPYSYSANFLVKHIPFPFHNLTPASIAACYFPTDLLCQQCNTKAVGEMQSGLTFSEHLLFDWAIVERCAIGQLGNYTLHIESGEAIFQPLGASKHKTWSRALCVRVCWCIEYKRHVAGAALTWERP